MVDAMKEAKSKHCNFECVAERVRYIYSIEKVGTLLWERLEEIEGRCEGK
jgi:hypothetical protein